MPQQQRKPKLVIADVPVKITFLHGEILLKEYADVIPVAFDPQTSEGNENAYMMHKLRKEGLTTESAIFEIASEHFKKQAGNIVTNISPKLTKPLAGQSLHIHVKRNGKSHIVHCSVHYFHTLLKRLLFLYHSPAFFAPCRISWLIGDWSGLTTPSRYPLIISFETCPAARATL
jgi:hypothetical protein